MSKINFKSTSTLYIGCIQYSNRLILFPMFSHHLSILRQYHNGPQNDHNTLVFSDYIQLLYNSFFIMFKTIAIGIIGIGQVIKKNNIKNLPSRGTRLVSSRHNPCSSFRLVLLSKILKFQLWFQRF